MAGTDASIRIKLGQIEVEYQGDASFLKKDLLETVKELLELQAQHPIAAAFIDAKAPKRGDDIRAVTFDHSTDTIANLIRATSGPDLVMAAAAHLYFVKRKQQFTRKEIIAEMRTATGHFNRSYINNMSTYLNSLKSQNRLRLTGQNSFALSNKEKQALEAKLAQAE
jgi:hypothetical protein